MIHDHPDYLALLRGVLVSPHDDLPRLVLADWLEENGHGARAAYIRVWVDSTNPNASAFRFGGVMLRDGAEPWGGDGAVHEALVQGADIAHERRGFVESVELTLAAFMGAAPLLFSRHPITDVTLTRVTPLNYAAGHWHWYAPGTARWMLPNELYGRLPRYPGGRGCAGGCYWTQSAALEALSAACVAYGRSVALGCTHDAECGRCSTPGTLSWRYDCPACKGTGRTSRPGLPPLTAPHAQLTARAQA